jgi:hypothetical protein
MIRWLIIIALLLGILAGYLAFGTLIFETVATLGDN